MADRKATELDIIIIGGGISGFASAITLSRAGHNVQILEQSLFKREAGFMITLGPNAIRVLNSFGFDASRARAVNCDSVETFDGKTLKARRRFTTNILAKHDQDHAKTFYRPDLHTELKRIALSPSEDHKSPVLRLGARVVQVDIETATVHLEDGTTISGDLIVGADGERSLVKAAFKEPEMLRTAPYRITRAIVPTDVLLSDEKFNHILESTRSRFAMFFHGDKVLSWFEGRGGTLQDLEAGYAVYPDDDQHAESDPIKAREQMLERFQDFHPDLVSALKKSTLIYDSPVNFSKPLANLYKSRAVLVGDAAHSMFPTTGQGGSQSLEDAAALGVLLSSLPSKACLERRLKMLENLRKKRTTVVQMLSGIVFGHEELFLANKSKVSGFIERAGISNGEDHLRFLYDYDIIAESVKALEEGERIVAQL